MLIVINQLQMLHFMLEEFNVFVELYSRVGGAPASLVQKIALAKKETAKARADKNSFPPTPFLFARPSD